MFVLGLMSGTSADGVDAVLATFQGSPSRPNWKLLKHFYQPYPTDLRKTIIDTAQGGKISADEWLKMTELITEVHAHVAKSCDPERKSQLIGCHGQTVWHQPPKNNKRGASLQLIQASLLAELLQCSVIYDFRALDLALGGQGAPLVPLTDAALIRKINGWRGFLNLGGIANLTLVPPLHGPERLCQVVGWDCGPANSLIDLAVNKLSKGTKNYDLDGEMASSGRPHHRQIKEWLKEPFFNLSPPKSTGREQFGIDDLEQRLQVLPSCKEEDIISTLTTFSAAIVGQELDNLYSRNLIRPIELVVSGGGSRNPSLMKSLRQLCKGIRVKKIEEEGIPSQAKEALAFALLAWWNHLSYPGNSPAITGASRKAILGRRANPS